MKDKLLTSAAVLVPLVIHETEPHILLTQRTPHLSAHAGEISFPGGREEMHDDSLIETALREAQEEIGLSLDMVKIIGQLDTYTTRTRYEVTPYVGLVSPQSDLYPCPNEVATIFELPLSFAQNPDNIQRQEIVLEGQPFSYHAIEYNGFHIWGATAGILMNLLDVIKD